MAQQGETSFAEKLQLLLERFLHPEGRPWRGSEIETRTDNFISQQYFSQLLNGARPRPGLRHLAAIADVMGFPFDLWLHEPSQWSRVLEDAGQHAQARRRRAASAAAVARKVNFLVATVPNPRTNRPYTTQELADRSCGRLTTRQVEALLDGDAHGLTYDQFLALSGIFDVAFDFFLEPEGRRPPPLLDAEILDALSSDENLLLLHRTRGLSKAHKDMLLLLAEQLEHIESTGSEESAPRLQRGSNEGSLA